MAFFKVKLVATHERKHEVVVDNSHSDVYFYHNKSNSSDNVFHDCLELRPEQAEALAAALLAAAKAARENEAQNGIHQNN